MKISHNIVGAVVMSLCLASSSECWGQQLGGAAGAEATAVGLASGVGTANATNNTIANPQAAISSFGSLSTGGSINSTTYAPAANLGKAVPNVYAPALAAAGYEVCLGSMSAGGSGAGFGFSVGSTIEDKSCQARLNAKTLATLGYAAAAREVMCQDPNVQLAMRHAGTPCANDIVVAGGPGCRQEWSIFSGYQQVCGP
jgi:hypothetical protein